VNSGFEKYSPGDKKPEPEVKSSVKGCVVRSMALYAGQGLQLEIESRDRTIKSRNAEIAEQHNIIHHLLTAARSDPALTNHLRSAGCVIE